MNKCFDARDMFINLRFDHNDNEHLFIHIICKNNEIYDGIKKLTKLKDKKVLCIQHFLWLLIIITYILENMIMVNLDTPCRLAKI